MLTLLLFYIGIGIVSILIALPLVLQLIKPNAFHGFRIRATLMTRLFGMR